MCQEIIPILLHLPFRMGSVNCYLIKSESKFVLVDTGCPTQSKELLRILDQFGCNSENLQLIILTHGDFDHSGNAACIKKKYNTTIAIHSEESNAVEHGNMFSNRAKGRLIQNQIVKTLFRFGKSQRFKPDIEITEGFDLSEYGIKAKVIHMPGHSKGSIGVLTVDGALLCGDLIENIDGPKINRLMDDLEKAKASIEMLKSTETDIVYPGHGSSFNMNSFLLN